MNTVKIVKNAFEIICSYCLADKHAIIFLIHPLTASLERSTEMRAEGVFTVSHMTGCVLDLNQASYLLN